MEENTREHGESLDEELIKEFEENLMKGQQTVPNSTNGSVSSEVGPSSTEKIIVTPPKTNEVEVALIEKETEEGSGGGSEPGERVPKKLTGATDESGRLMFLFQMKDMEKAFLIPAEIANEKYPQTVIEFYQARFKWNPPADYNIDDSL